MTDWVLTLNAMGEAQLAWFPQALLWTGALVLLARLLDALLSRRVAASWRQALYLVALFRLALPMSWETQLGVLPSASAPVSSMQWEGVPAPHVVVTSTVAAPLPQPVLSPRLKAVAVLPFIHLGGTLCLLGWMLLERRRLKARLLDALPARPELASLARGVAVREHASVGPAVAGVLRPVVVLPTQLVDRLSTSELAAVLRHELAHVSRRDPLAAAFVQLSLAVLWPLLPLWYAAHRAFQLFELACDERALAESAPGARAAYGEALLAVAAWAPARARPALGLLSFGGALRARLVALRHRRRWSGAGQVLSVGVLATLMMAGSGTRPAAREELTLAAGTAGLVGAEGTIGSERLDVDFKGTGLLPLLRVLADVQGLELEVRPPLPQEEIDFVMSELRWSRAMELVCDVAGLSAEREDGVLRITAVSAPHERALDREGRLISPVTFIDRETEIIQARPMTASSFRDRVYAVAEASDILFWLVQPQGRGVWKGGHEVVIKGSADSRAAIWGLKDALKREFSGHVLRLGKIEERSGGRLAFEARVRMAVEGITPARVVPPVAIVGQVLLEFRIILFEADVAIPSPDTVSEELAEHWMTNQGRLNTFSLDMHVSQLEVDRQAQIVTTPRVMVRLGETAHIESGSTVRKQRVSDTRPRLAPEQLNVVVRSLSEMTPVGVTTHWTVELAQPEAHLEGTVVGDGFTGSSVVRLADGRQVVVWVTNSLQER